MWEDGLTTVTHSRLASSFIRRSVTFARLARMDKSTNKMSSPATLGDESSPWQSSGTSAGEDDLVHEEAMLKRKLAILEEFMDSGEI